MSAPRIIATTVRSSSLSDFKEFIRICGMTHCENFAILSPEQGLYFILHLFRLLRGSLGESTWICPLDTLHA